MCRPSLNRSWLFTAQIAFASHSRVFLPRQQGRTKGDTMPPGYQKVPTMPGKHFLQYNAFAHTKDLMFEHEGAKFISCPRRHRTSVRPCSHFPEQGLGLSAHACLAARRVVVTLTAAQAWCQFCNKQQNLNAFCSYLAVHFQKLSAEDRQASAARRSDGRRKKAKV